MPSHLSHWVLATRAAENTLSRLEQRRLFRHFGAELTLGAQGPDIFLHNHRRKPRGLHFGAVLHRKGNATLVTELGRAVYPVRTRNGAVSAIGAYTIGYITHVFLDRIGHPFVNYFAGWRGVPDSILERPFMHSFLERLIDVQVLDHFGLPAPSDLGFAAMIDGGSRITPHVALPLAAALRAALSAAADDPELELRLQNAYQDSVAFYRFTDKPDLAYLREGRRRELSGTTGPRWLALIHPPASLIDCDVLNRERRPWVHPCDPTIESRESFVELFARALRAAAGPIELLYRLGATPRRHATARAELLVALSEAIGPWNLNDGMSTDPPAPRLVTRPLPLIELYRQIKLQCA